MPEEVTERTWRGRKESELLPVRLPLDSGVDLDDTQRSPVIQVFALLLRVQSLSNRHNDIFLPISRNNNRGNVVKDSTLLPALNNLGRIELTLLKPKEHEEKLDAEENSNPPPNPPPPLIIGHKPGSNWRHCTARIGDPNIDTILQPALMHEKYIRHGHLHHHLCQRPQPTLQRINTPPITGSHCSSSPNHDSELSDAAEDVDRTEAVFQCEGNEHRRAKGEGGATNGVGVVEGGGGEVQFGTHGAPGRCRRFVSQCICLI